MSDALAQRITRYPCQCCKRKREKCTIRLYVEGCSSSGCAPGGEFLDMKKYSDINVGLQKVMQECNTWNVNAEGSTVLSIVDVGNSIIRCEECRVQCKPFVVAVSCESCCKHRKVRKGADVRVCVADDQLKQFIALLVREALAAGSPQLPPGPSSHNDDHDQASSVNNQASLPEACDTRHGTAMSHISEPRPHAEADPGPSKPPLSIDVSYMAMNRREPPITAGSSVGHEVSTPESMPIQSEDLLQPIFVSAVLQAAQQDEGIVPSPFAQAQHVYPLPGNDAEVPTIAGGEEALEENPDSLLDDRVHTITVDSTTPSTYFTREGTLMPETPATAFMGANVYDNRYKPLYSDDSGIHPWNVGVVNSPHLRASSGNDYLQSQYFIDGFSRAALDGPRIYSPGYQGMPTPVPSFGPQRIHHVVPPSGSPGWVSGTPGPSPVSDTYLKHTLVANPQVYSEKQGMMPNDHPSTFAAYNSPEIVRRDAFFAGMPSLGLYNSSAPSAVNAVQSHIVATPSRQSVCLPGTPGSLFQHSNSTAFTSPEVLRRNQASLAGNQPSFNHPTQHASPGTAGNYSLSGSRPVMPTPQIDPTLNGDHATHFPFEQYAPKPPHPGPSEAGPSRNPRTSFRSKPYPPHAPGRQVQASSSSQAPVPEGRMRNESF